MKAAIALLMLCILISCGSKKKLIEKTEFTTEIATVERVKELEEKSVETKTETTAKSEIHSIAQNSDVVLTQADPAKEITLIDSEGRITIIKGANAIISSRKETAKNLDTFVQKIDNTELSKIDKSQTTKKDLKEIEKNKTTKKEKSGRFPWWILILAGAYFIVSFFRKSLNPLRWL